MYRLLVELSAVYKDSYYSPSFFFKAFSTFCSDFTNSPLYNLPIYTDDGATSPRNRSCDRSSLSWQAFVQPTSTYNPTGRKWFRQRSRERWRKSSENKPKQLRRISRANGKAKRAKSQKESKQIGVDWVVLHFYFLLWWIFFFLIIQRSSPKKKEWGLRSISVLQRAHWHTLTCPEHWKPLKTKVERDTKIVLV